MLTEEQLKIRAFGEELNRKAIEPRESAQEIIDLLPNQKIKWRTE